MPVIHLTTIVHAPVERVFNLSRHRGLYVQCMQWHPQKHSASKSLGLLEEGELLSWQAKIFGKNRLFRTKLSQMQPVGFLQQVMPQSNWIHICHQQHFKPLANGAVMIDEFSFQPAHPAWNNLFLRLLVTPRLRRLLERKNAIMKQVAESEEWKQYLSA